MEQHPGELHALSFLAPRSPRQHWQHHETTGTEHCHLGNPTCLGFLLEFSHIDMIDCQVAYVSSPSIGRADTIWLSAPALNHILRLSGPNVPSDRTLQGESRDGLPGAKGKGQTSLWARINFFATTYHTPGRLQRTDHCATPKNWGGIKLEVA